jgi:biopolymer transport protein ExbB
MNARTARFTLLLAAFLGLFATAAHAGSWWDGEWTVRKKITLDLSSTGSAITETVGGATVLLRFHEGNFQFAAAKEDGSDIRFVTEDDKTVLPYHIEKFDPLMNEAFVWVKLPEIKAGEQTKFWVYYGSGSPKAARVSDPKISNDADTVLVYHFAERTGPAGDSSGHGFGSTEAFVPADAMIGGGARLTGAKAITLPEQAELTWANAQALTWSLWVKSIALAANATIFSRQEGANSFTVGEDNGVPFVAVNGQRAAAAAPIAANAWHHLAVVAAEGKVTLYVNGERTGEISAAIPALQAAAKLGGEGSNFTGDVDELVISRVARSAGWVKLAAYTQGADKSAKALVFGADEQKHSFFESGTFGPIMKNLTVDGWAVIGLLGVMLVISWWLMITKIGYMNSLSKGNAMFMREWSHLSSDLTALDHGDAESVRTLGGRANDKKSQRNLRRASVYRLYHIGSEEIRHRVSRGRSLSTRSIQAIRAALDGGLVREKQRIDKLIVLLTICISGGPFLGLFGTVLGVMITFAEVAKAGDVNVAAIAPGIAAALLATVAGLAVAIPALFGYNYILSRVKDATADMHVFIDEFVAKMAEFYSETEPPRNHVRHVQKAEEFELEAVH